MDARERTLVSVNTYDILGALGLQDVRFLRRWLDLAVRRPARSFARQVAAFDDAVRQGARGGASGLREAARVLLASHADRFTVRGADFVPARGPALILSNHPGMTDAVALFAAVPRADLKVLAADRPFLRALPSVARALIFVPDDRDGAAAAARVAAVRAAVGHLKAGGALLTFPAGEIEPDPAVLPGAVEALSRWSASTGLFPRLVPECVVVPAVVSGVLSARAQRHPLTLLRKTRKDREWLGSMLQIVVRAFFPGAWPVRVAVDFLEPFPAVALPRRPEDSLEAVRERVAGFLRSRARE